MKVFKWLTYKGKLDVLDRIGEKHYSFICISKLQIEKLDIANESALKYWPHHIQQRNENGYQFWMVNRSDQCLFLHTREEKTPLSPVTNTVKISFSSAETEMLRYSHSQIEKLSN